MVDPVTTAPTSCFGLIGDCFVGAKQAAYRETTSLPKTIQESVINFITNSNNRLANFMRQAEGRDKLSKTIIATFEIIDAKVSASNASQATKDGVRSTKMAVKDARTVFSLVNVIAGFIPLLISSLIDNFKLVKGLLTQNEVELPIKSGIIGDPKQKKAFSINYTLKTPVEKLLGFVYSVSTTVSLTSYVVGFGAFRPAGFVHKHFGSQVSASAKEMGAAFPLVMIGNHAGDFVNGLLGVMFEWWLYLSRSEGRDPIERPYHYATFVANIFKNYVFGLVEKSMELFMDFTNLYWKKAPLGMKLGVNLSIGLIGCYKVWLKTGPTTFKSEFLEDVTPGETPK